MNAKSEHRHLLNSRHILRENGCHRHVVSSSAAIEFLVIEGNSVGVIYKRLRGVYGDACMGKKFMMTPWNCKDKVGQKLVENFGNETHWNAASWWTEGEL